MRMYLLTFVVLSILFSNTAHAQRSIKLFGHIGKPADTVAYWFNDNKSKRLYITGGKDENYAVTIKPTAKDTLINFTFPGTDFSCELTLKTQDILSYVKRHGSMRCDLILAKYFCESTIECEFTNEQRKLESDWINTDNQILKLKDCSNYQKETMVSGTTYVEQGSWSIRDGFVQLKPAYLVNKETGALAEAGAVTLLSIGDALVSKDNVTYKRKTLTLQELKELMKKH